LFVIEAALDEPEKLRVDRAPVAFRKTADASVQILREPD
jgi:hypothetical protein